jgi:predicted HicB family RNase H-like nuclease
MKRAKAGRPARTDEPVRLVVRVPAELKRWLAHHAIDEGGDMGQFVTEALEAYRKRVRGKP